MRKALGVVVGVLMLAFGGLWAAQGLGYLGGSPASASHSSIAAVLGPIVAGLGVALIYVSIRGTPAQRQ